MLALNEEVAMMEGTQKPIACENDAKHAPLTIRVKVDYPAGDAFMCIPPELTFGDFKTRLLTLFSALGPKQINSYRFYCVAYLQAPLTFPAKAKPDLPLDSCGVPHRSGGRNHPLSSPVFLAGDIHLSLSSPYQGHGDFIRSAPSFARRGAGALLHVSLLAADATGRVWLGAGARHILPDAAADGAQEAKRLASSQGQRAADKSKTLIDSTLTSH